MISMEKISVKDVIAHPFIITTGNLHADKGFEDIKKDKIVGLQENKEFGYTLWSFSGKFSDKICEYIIKTTQETSKDIFVLLHKSGYNVPGKDAFIGFDKKYLKNMNIDTTVLSPSSPDDEVILFPEALSPGKAGEVTGSKKVMRAYVIEEFFEVDEHFSKNSLLDLCRSYSGSSGLEHEEFYFQGFRKEKKISAINNAADQIKGSHDTGYLELKKDFDISDLITDDSFEYYAFKLKYPYLVKIIK